MVHAAVLGLRVACFLVSQTNMPFLSIYLLALEQDMEHGTSVLQAANTLQQQTFLQVRGRKAVSEGSSPAAGQRGRLVVASLVLLPRAALPETGIQLPLGSTTARARHPRALLWPQRLNEPKLPARCWVLRGVRYKVWEEKTHSLANPRAPPYPSPPRPRSPCTPPPAPANPHPLSGAVCREGPHVPPPPRVARAQPSPEGNRVWRFPGCRFLSATPNPPCKRAQMCWGMITTATGSFSLQSLSAKGRAASGALRPPWGLFLPPDAAANSETP